MIELALEILEEDRKKYLIDKIMKKLSNNDNFYCFCIPKFLIDFPLGIFGFLLATVIFFFDLYNSTDSVFKIKCEDLDSYWEKNEEEQENIKSGIFACLILCFILSYLYFFTLSYVLYKKKYFKEFLPYFGGKNNGFALLILLKNILENYIPIYYLILFPLLINEHKGIILSYFKLYSFNTDKEWIIFMKAILYLIIILYIICCCHKHEELCKLIKNGVWNKLDDNVSKGKKYFDDHSFGARGNKFFPLMGTSD